MSKMTIKVRESKKKVATTEDILVKLTELKDVLDAGKVLDDLKKLGFYTIEYGDYASKDKAYAVLKHPNGMYAELDYTWVQDSSGRDNYSPGEIVTYDYFKDKDEYEEIHGYSPRESKKNEAYSDYDAIRGWLEGVMTTAGTMFESAYVSENRPGEICAEIEGYDSTGGDAIISLVWNAGEDFAETISAMADELVEYAEDFDPEEEAEMYRNSGMAGVPSLRQLLKAMDERKEDMVSLAGAVSLAASKL